MLRDLGFLLALIINILIFGWYKKREIIGVREKDNQYIDKSSGSVISDANGELVITYSSEDDFEFAAVIDKLGIVSIVLSVIIVAFFLSRNAPLLIEKAWVGASKDRFNLVKYLIRLLKTIWYLLTDFYVLYYLLYGAAAVFGTLYHPFLFAFHLFEVLIRFPVLLNVVKSVWIPRK